MRKFLALALCATALAVSVSFAGTHCLAQAQTQAASSSASSERAARVDQLMASLVPPTAPGVAVMVIRNGQVVKSTGYGLANLETRAPVTAQTIFDLASVSKQFTAMAVMILAERGKLSLDDPVTKFFPEFPAYARKVTVRHLLNHTSGLVDEINPSWFRSGYQPTSRDLLKMMAGERKVNFEPGAKFEYNNAGYVLLALIVEKVSGQKFSKFMSENIFKPAGMTHTLVYDETKPQVTNLAVSYFSDNGVFKPTGYQSDVFLYGPKGVLTSAEDLFKWDRAIETNQLVKTATMAQAFAPTKLNDGTTIPYGFGWYLAPDNGLTVEEHAGGYLGYRTAIRRYPSEHTTVIVLSNNSTVESGPLARKIGQIYVAGQSAPAAAVRVDENVLRSYVGKYEGDPAVMPNLIIEITLEGGELFITSPVRPKTKLLAQSETEFQIEETAASVTFNRDAQGRVTGLLLKTRRGTVNARKLPG